MEIHVYKFDGDKFHTIFRAVRELISLNETSGDYWRCIIGLCSAYYLNKQGYEVTVIESGHLADGTSFGNAGYVLPSHFIPLASPAVVGNALRRMLNPSSPFYIKPRLDSDLVRWGMAFWRSSWESYMRLNIPHLNNILCLSRELTISQM